MQESEIFEIIKLKFSEVTSEVLTNTVVVPKQLFLEVVSYLRSAECAFANLHCITAIDRRERIEVVYIFYSFKMRKQIILKICLTPDDLQVESLAGFYKSADWFEREAYDLFGVKFLNHPDLSRILNPSGWEGYPLRKDYAHPNFIKKPQY